MPDIITEKAGGRICQENLNDRAVIQAALGWLKGSIVKNIRN